MSNERVVPIEVSVRVNRNEKEVHLAFDANEETFGIDMEEAIGAGTRDYNRLKNKPSINDVELVGDKSFAQLGLESLTNEEIEILLRLAGGI